jgi:hypothetical protein
LAPTGLSFQYHSAPSFMYHRRCIILATDTHCEYGGSMLRHARWHCVIIQTTTVCDSYPLVQTVHRAEVCSVLCGIRTTTTPAPEELGLCEVVTPVRGSPQCVRVADGQVLAFADRLHYVNDQTSARREALVAVRATAVLQQRSLVIHGQVRGFRQRHLVTVYLKKIPSLNYDVENLSEDGLWLLFSGIWNRVFWYRNTNILD